MVQVDLTLIRNPKTVSSKPFVAKVDLEKGEIQFVKPVIPRYVRGVLTGGVYDLEPGYYIIRIDASSHKHSSQVYTLNYFDGQQMNEVARIVVSDGNKSFYPDELQDIYIKVKTSGQNNYIVRTLIEYAKLQQTRNSVDVEQIIKNEILAFVAELEKKYGVKIDIKGIEIQK